MTRKKKMVVNFILDETASMGVVRDATINGFNEYITSLKSDEKTNILFSLTKFNSDKVDTMHVCEPIDKIKELTRETYQPSSMTPLYDAIGKTVADTEKVLKEIRGKPHVLCVVQTDGQENCSRTYDLSKIRSLISEKEKDGWTFVYLGANLDAARDAQFIGVPVANTLSYDNTTVGTQTAFRNMGGATSKLSASVADSAVAASASSADFFSTGGKGIDKRDKA